MENPPFLSKLDEKISYDNIFEVTEIDEDDKDYESNLYKINIFGNEHHIAMGKKRINNDNKLLAFFLAYLVQQDKVVTKLGIFEKLYFFRKRCCLMRDQIIQVSIIAQKLVKI